MLNVILMLMSLILAPDDSIYDYSFKTIDGKKVNFSQFKGKKILIVNTASKCGYTSQYEDLEKLHKQYGKKLVVVGFPAGNFNNQELATNSEIAAFCKENYGVSFLLSEKVSVAGKDINPLFRFLTSSNNQDFTGEIKWNFEKFLINEKGQLVNRFRSATKPMSPEILKNI